MWSGAEGSLKGRPLIPSFLYQPKDWKPGFLSVLSFTFHSQVWNEQGMGPWELSQGLSPSSSILDTLL